MKAQTKALGAELGSQVFSQTNPASYAVNARVEDQLVSKKFWNSFNGAYFIDLVVSHNGLQIIFLFKVF